VDLDLDLRIVDLDLHLDLAVPGLVTSLITAYFNVKRSGFIVFAVVNLKTILKKVAYNAT